VAKRRGSRREHAEVTRGAAAGTRGQVHEDFAVGRSEEQELVGDRHRAQSAAGAIDGRDHMHALCVRGGRVRLRVKKTRTKQHEQNEYRSEHTRDDDEIIFEEVALTRIECAVGINKSQCRAYFKKYG